MSFSSDLHEGRPMEGLFVSQVEQRVGHRDREDELGLARRLSEGARRSPEPRLAGHFSNTAPPKPTNMTAMGGISSWLRLPWNLRQGRSALSTHALRAQQYTGSNTANNSSWWNPRRYRRLSLGSIPTVSTATATAAASGPIGGAVRHVQLFVSTLAATAVASNSRRKGWFLSLILVSLVFTVLMGGHLLNQLHYQQELGSVTGPFSGDVGEGVIPVDPGSGPRRDRTHGKKNRGPKVAPAKPTKPSKDITAEHNISGVDGSSDLDIGSDNSDGGDAGDSDQLSHEAPSKTLTKRICNLEDVARGHWGRSDSKRVAPAWRMGQDLSWTGYGRNGCRSNIWNERYLLTPSVRDNTTSSFNKDSLQMDQTYAWHLKGFQWRLDQGQRQKQQQQQQQSCQQPEMDVEDFVDVLKRAPLVMIGDKFLEREYLAMECMILGMQDQLWTSYQSEHGKTPSSDGDTPASLEYRIEPETPPIVELQVAPGSLSQSSSSTTAAAGNDHSAIYRKAKPGQMRLIDRVSNLTFATFIRSDVLWDSDMLTAEISKHTDKSTADVSIPDAGGLHPDCKLVGTILLCEPARREVKMGASSTNPQSAQQPSSWRWWQWWVGSQEALDDTLADTRNEDDHGEMSFGSDFDRDMINLEWVQQLQEVVQDDLKRNPVVVISSGHFWEYDPQDVAQLDLITEQKIRQKDRKLTKAEMKQIRDTQDRRRKLLRQRYTTVLTNMLHYIKATYPTLRVVVQTSVRQHETCVSGAMSAAEKALQDSKYQEAALLNALTKTVVARMQDPLYAFLDTTLLQVFKDTEEDKRHCSSFTMPDSTRQNQHQQQQRQQQRPARHPQQPVIQQHQPFPSSTSSFSIRHSNYSSSGFLGPNDSTRISFLQQGSSVGSNLSNSSANFPIQYNHTIASNGHHSSTFERRTPPRFYSLIDPGSGTLSSSGANRTARARQDIIRSKSASAALLHGSSSDLNSLYSIDNTASAILGLEDSEDDDEDESGGGARQSYFGSAGQDYLLKQKRARRAKLICLVDVITLIAFTIVAGLRPVEADEESWTWDWERVAWPLTALAVVRILLMAFTARYSDGNYNVAVIFVCVSITLFIMFQVNMIVQHRLELTALLIAQYSVSLILSQLHWISYSTHTPMSAALAYGYDPLLSEGITFSRESRHNGGRISGLRHGTSYGTMNSSRFSAVQEQDESMNEEDDDHDVFIKVNVDRKTTSSSSRRRKTRRSTAVDGGVNNDESDDAGGHEDEDGEDEDEEQDMATLLAFQDARRQQAYAFSPQDSSSGIAARVPLAPQTENSSWAFQGRQSFTSSYDRRLAASGGAKAGTSFGGLTLGYVPRKRSLRSNLDPNGTGRRTWTGGHNIIYSGIFGEDSDEEVDEGRGVEGVDPARLQEEEDDDDEERRFGSHSRENTEFDDTIKAEYDDSKADGLLVDQGQFDDRVVDGERSELEPAVAFDGQSRPRAPLDISTVMEAVDSPPRHQQHPHFIEDIGDSQQMTTAVDSPEGDTNGDVVLEGRQHHAHGLSTLKFHVSSHKDITAVMCEDDNCSEHQFQEGPAAELIDALGSGFTGGNIVQLDIKETSTSAVEKIGDGINNFEDSSLPSTIRDIPTHHIGDLTGTTSKTPRPVPTVEDKGSGNTFNRDNDSGEVQLEGCIDSTRLELDIEVDMNQRPQPDALAIDDIQAEDAGRRRIHIRERIERTLVEEEDIDIYDTRGPILPGSGGQRHPSAITVGGVVVIDEPSMTTVQPTGRSPTSVPGQWVQIQDLEQPTGAITWGIVDDIPQSFEEGIYIDPAPKPIVYIPPQRTAIVDAPQPQAITIAPPPEPIFAIDTSQPRQVILPPPQPVVRLQPAPQPVVVPQPQPPPRMLIRPPPPPIVYAPPPRPVLIPPPPPIVYEPPPRPVLIPPPRSAFIQPQPVPIPVAPAFTVQPQVLAPAPPLLQSEYGTYETIVPGVPTGAGVMGGGTVPLNRGYPVASIYGDRSAVSIYEDDIHSVASIYDDRTIVSINELEGGPAVVPMGGPVPRRPWMRGQPLAAMGYGQSHLISAAHVPRQTELMNQHVARANDMDMDQESDLYLQRDHAVGRSTPLHYEPYAERNKFSDRSTIEHQHVPQYTDQAEQEPYYMGAEEQVSRSVNRHEQFPSDSANTEISSYQEISLQEVPLQDSPLHLQEIAIETYFDTTKSQLKVREQQGQLLSEMAQQLKKRQQQIQEKQRQQQELQRLEHVQREKESEQKQEAPQSKDYLPSPPSSSHAITEVQTLPASPVSSLSRSLQLQQQQQQQQQRRSQSPPTFNIPRPPLSPPPVRLLANRGLTSPFSPPRGIPIPSSPPDQYRQQRAGMSGKADVPARAYDDDGNSEPILSTSAQNTENIMLQARHPKSGNAEVGFVSISLDNTARPTTLSNPAHGKPPLPGTPMKVAAAATVASSMRGTTSVRKARQRQQIPPMSRHHLHPALLQEGIMACWNNEFGAALEVFKEHSATYPRWSLATAEVHIVRQLMCGQLSEADSELMDALQMSEKVASRVLDRKQEFDSNFMSYRSICSTDASLVTANDNTLRQNYKWDCEMAFYDALLYRGILQLTAASDTKGTFSDIKGGLQLRRAWKGYMRIKQEIEIAKERWQKLTSLVQSTNDEKATSAAQDQRAVREDIPSITTATTTQSGHILKSGRPRGLTKTVTMPINIPSSSIAPTPSSSKRSAPLSTSQPPETSRWSIFGRRRSMNHSTSSLSSSPPDASELQQNSEQSGSWFLPSSPSAARGLASVLREQTKAAEDIKTAVKVLEDIEDYVYYGIGLFYFIVSIVPKSLLPALRTIGLQTNHEQGIKNLEAVFARKNGRAPFAALFLSINYLFLPRGMSDPSISLGRAGEIIDECLKTCPNGSSYLLMACHHARKTGNMIPSALNHITRGIQTCEAAVIPSINYRFELGLTFFINQEFSKAADIFEILWRRYITVMPIGTSTAGSAAATGIGAGVGRRRKGRSQSVGQPSRNDYPIGSGTGASFGIEDEEDEEDDFELAPFCGLCLIASKVVVRLGQEGYFEYGRDGFGHHSTDGAMSPSSGILFDGGSSSRMNASGSTTPLHFPRPGPDFDLLVAAQEVLMMMLGADQGASIRSSVSGSIFEHSKMGSGQSADATGSKSTTASHLLSSSASPQGKLNRFNKFAWNQCQKSLQQGRISPFLPLVILYLRRDLAYMKPALLRKFRTLLETIWKSVQQEADADMQAIYLLLSAVVHRQLLPDDATFAYTALTDCLLLESAIESEMWVVPHCHYELGELLYKKLHLPHAALEQFQWIVKGPGKEAQTTSIFYAGAPAASNHRLSVFGGGYPSDTVTNIVEGAIQAAQAAAAISGRSNRVSSGHSNYPSSASNHRLSQLAPAGHSSILGTSPTHVAAATAAPPNPVTFYNSRYKKFEFSQALRHRSSVSLEQVQKAIESGVAGAAGSEAGSVPASRRTSVSVSTGAGNSNSNMMDSAGGYAESVSGTVQNDPLDVAQLNEGSRKRSSSQSIDLTGNAAADSGSPKAARIWRAPRSPSTDEPSSSGQQLQHTAAPISTSGTSTVPVTRSSSESAAQMALQNGWIANTLPNILSDAQRKRGSLQQPLRPNQSVISSSVKQ
ncbi:hypothetical protein BGZ98_003130 [Dissophora globulifera]|nr:hypothetical protein BGZ98_003130 [Dissophora globulifera]